MATETTTEQKTLTKSDALQKGYTHCGFTGEQWQSPMDINDLSDEEISKGNIVLFNKESVQMSIGLDDVKDAILERISQDESDIGCDTDQFLETAQKFDFEKLGAVIDEFNTHMASEKYYLLTDIKLIP